MISEWDFVCFSTALGSISTDSSFFDARNSIFVQGWHPEILRPARWRVMGIAHVQSEDAMNIGLSTEDDAQDIQY